MVKYIYFKLAAIQLLIGGYMTASDKPVRKIAGNTGGVVQTLLFSMSKNLGCDSLELMTFSIPGSERTLVMVRKDCKGKLEDECYMIVKSGQSWAPTRVGNASVKLNRDLESLIFENKPCTRVDHFSIKSFSIE